jgi:serine/threonine protein kinase
VREDLESKTPKFLAGRYQIIKRLATGSMGSVFLAIDKKLGDMEVALKILHSKFLSDDIVFKRFANEVIVARKLSHKNIVRIYDFEEAESGERIISMEFVHGTTFDSLLYELHGDVDYDADVSCCLYESDFKRLLTIFRSILEGVAYAHEQGILHRDLKPSNILIDESDQVKIADFGLAAVAGSSSGLTTDNAALIGTPDYMAPEHVQGQRMTARSDIYSLGMIAFEMITGRPAFIADSPLAVAYKQVKDSLPSLAYMPEYIPKNFINLIKRATLKDPTERFSSVQEMIDFLDRKAKPGDITTTLYKTSVMKKSNNIKKHSFGARPVRYSRRFTFISLILSIVLIAMVAVGSFRGTSVLMNTYFSQEEVAEVKAVKEEKPLQAAAVVNTKAKKKKSSK